MNHFSKKISAIKIHENQNISKHRNPVNEIMCHVAINGKSSFYVIKIPIITDEILSLAFFSLYPYYIFSWSSPFSPCINMIKTSDGSEGEIANGEATRQTQSPRCAAWNFIKKGDSGTGVFLLILRKSKNTLYRTPPGDCF